MIDLDETIVLPESELPRRRPRPLSREEDGADIAFDETLVLEDELEKRRRSQR